jgi:hypothetical protein
MSRYNSNYGSHDQLQELRKLNMDLYHQIDKLKIEVDELKKNVEISNDELVLAHEAMRKAFPENIQTEVTKWRNLALMMSHFDICISARIKCNICSEARQAYAKALSDE